MVAVRTLRSAIRKRRANLLPAEVGARSARISALLWKLPQMARSRRIACYVAVAGEVDCGPIMQEALDRHRQVYLPLLHGKSLMFARWNPAGAMAANRFGIPEPTAPRRSWISARDLDVVLTPLVAFDSAGHRLGMGGGFYDRALAFTSSRGNWRHPWIIGVGYAFQQVDALPARDWDVGLHGAVTEIEPHLF